MAERIICYQVPVGTDGEKVKIEIESLLKENRFGKPNTGQKLTINVSTNHDLPTGSNIREIEVIEVYDPQNPDSFVKEEFTATIK